jgi:holo-[acyl-carrier protein] synthase
VAIVGVGIDVVDVPRFALALERRATLAGRLFTDAERHDAKYHPERLAARFAAKEAVLKALGVGIGGAPWKSIEIHRDDSGAPSVQLHDAAAALAARCGVDEFHISMSHTMLTAVAFAVGSSRDPRDAG